MSKQERALPSDASLAAYVGGALESQERSAVEGALRDDPEARRRVAQMEQLTSALAAPLPEIECIDMPRRVREAWAVRKKARKTRLIAWSVVASAACVVLGVATQLAKRDVAEFQSRDANPQLDEGRRWSGVRIYRATSDTQVERVASEIKRQDRLLFSYTNLGATPFQHLMIFAVDGERNVYWSYPAYEAVSSNPSSTPITSRADEPLPDLVEHTYPAGVLTFYALFSQQALHVREVEDWIASDPSSLATHIGTDASLQVIQLAVGP